MMEVGEDARAAIASAEDAARSILAEAEANAETIRRDAWDAGFAEGKAALVARLEQQVAADVRRIREAEVASLVQALRAAVDEVVRRRDRLERDAKDQIVALAVNIARVVVKREIALTPEIAKLNLEEAIRLSARRAKLIVRVSETDMKTLGGILGPSALAADADAPVEMVPSNDIQPGGCLIESASGAVDARVETQLREIEKLLLGEPPREEAVHGG